MEKYLFRGKPMRETDYYFFSKTWKDNCKDGFVYGSLIVSGNRYYICVATLCALNCYVNNGNTSMIEVIPGTVNQYTGLIDKNGTKIFEGDIIRYFDEYIEEVYWSKHCLGFYATDGRNKCEENNYLGNFYGYKCEVIGNMQDNPELLGGAE